MENVKNFAGLVGRLDGVEVMNFYYIYKLSVPRKSGAIDKVDVAVPFPLHFAHPEIVADIPCASQVGILQNHIIVSGCVRKMTQGQGRPTHVYVEAAFIGAVKHPYFQNGIRLKGIVANKPEVRVTPKGRRIADVMLAIPDAGSDRLVRIPCICWGRNAERASTLKVGDTLEVSGRLQSREYVKKHDDGTLERRTTHEVSVSRMQF